VNPVEICRLGSGVALLPLRFTREAGLQHLPNSGKVFGLPAHDLHVEVLCQGVDSVVTNGGEEAVWNAHKLSLWWPVGTTLTSATARFRGHGVCSCIHLR